MELYLTLDQQDEARSQHMAGYYAASCGDADRRGAHEAWRTGWSSYHAEQARGRDIAWESERRLRMMEGY